MMHYKTVWLGYYEAAGMETVDSMALFQEAVNAGKVTYKEKELWNFVLPAYGYQEFSTKKLERDFGDAAYATIRSFWLKFTELGLLRAVQYGNRVRYKIRDSNG